jgi:4'-phosphopantetheinyl transferase
VKVHAGTDRASIYLINIDTVPTDQFAGHVARLSATEQERYQRFMLPQRQRQFVAGRMLLRWSLAQLLAVPPDAIELTEQERRAPLLHLPALGTPPGFSISHSGNWVACACSAAAQLGLDIELLNSKRNLVSIAEHSFRQQDVAWLHAQTDTVAAFYHLWSSKEARYKLTQRYQVDAVEHCYAQPHPQLSMVLMSDRALAAPPVFIPLEWSALDAAV